MESLLCALRSLDPHVCVTKLEHRAYNKAGVEQEAANQRTIRGRGPARLHPRKKKKKSEWES